jgi:hypothetical protein
MGTSDPDFSRDNDNGVLTFEVHYIAATEPIYFPR